MSRDAKFCGESDFIGLGSAISRNWRKHASVFGLFQCSLLLRISIFSQKIGFTKFFFKFFSCNRIFGGLFLIFWLTVNTYIRSLKIFISLKNQFLREIDTLQINLYPLKFFESKSNFYVKTKFVVRKIKSWSSCISRFGYKLAFCWPFCE